MNRRNSSRDRPGGLGATKNESMVDVYRRLSQQAMKNAYTARDDVYTRKGQSKAPRFASISGNVKNPTRS